jgi:hypothetical protein
LLQADTQRLSQAVLQQYASALQTSASQAQPGQPGVLLLVRALQSELHTPQSLGHVPQCSVESHLLLPHTG